jgi:hypothetical protein
LLETAKAPFLKMRVMTDFDAEFPIIPHESAGVDCIGCIIVKVTGNDAMIDRRQREFE